MIITTLISHIKAWFRYRRNVEVLSHLTDRELADIGISRGEIDRTARTISA